MCTPQQYILPQSQCNLPQQRCIQQRLCNLPQGSYKPPQKYGAQQLQVQKPFLISTEIGCATCQDRAEGYFGVYIGFKMSQLHCIGGKGWYDAASLLIHADNLRRASQADYGPSIKVISEEFDFDLYMKDIGNAATDVIDAELSLRRVQIGIKPNTMLRERVTYLQLVQLIGQEVSVLQLNANLEYCLRSRGELSFTGGEPTVLGPFDYDDLYLGSLLAGKWKIEKKNPEEDWDITIGEKENPEQN